MGQHIRPFRSFRRLPTVLGDLPVPLAPFALLVRLVLLSQGDRVHQLILLFRLLRALLLGQDFRPFRSFRPLLPILGDLRPPIPRAALLVRPFPLCQGGLEVQLLRLFHLLRAFLLRQHLRPHLPFHRVLAIL